MTDRPKRVDKNQKSIVQALRQVGVIVADIHAAGFGVPDIILGLRGLMLIGDFDRVEVMRRLQGIEGLKILQGCNVLVEIKNPEASGGWKLTPCEKDWHKSWKGQKAIVETVDEALALCGKK